MPVPLGWDMGAVRSMWRQRREHQERWADLICLAWTRTGREQEGKNGHDSFPQTPQTNTRQGIWFPLRVMWWWWWWAWEVCVCVGERTRGRDEKVLGDGVFVFSVGSGLGAKSWMWESARTATERKKERKRRRRMKMGSKLWVRAEIWEAQTEILRSYK